MIDPKRLTVPLLRKLGLAIAEQRDDTAAVLVGGNAPDFPEYRYQAGLIAGLEAALEHARELDAQVDGEAPLERR